jgi:hypothetical protein
MLAARMLNVARVSTLAMGVLLASCGGGGGGSEPPPNQSPVANAGPDQTTSACALVALAGSGTDADGTVAGFTWTQTAGQPAVALSNAAAANPTFSSPVVSAATDFTFNLVVRDNTGASSAADTVTIRINPISATTVNITGNVTYDRVPFNAQRGTGLNYGGILQEAARGIRVEARGSGTQAAECVFASGRTDSNGAYALAVPANQSTAIRAIAHLLRQAPEAPPHYDIAVRNGNADDGPTPLPEPYSFTGQPFDSSALNGNQNVNIPHGWNAATRQPTGAGSRQSAPFAILGTIQRALDFLTAPAAGTGITIFPVLNIDWSETKTAGNTFYASAAGDAANPDPDSRYISLSGEAGVDMDEFDHHTIAHEFGHYIEDRFSRSDSVGGQHTAGDRLDPRVAFGEGFGYAFAAMVLNDPVVRDAIGSLQSSDFNFSVETDSTDAEGWFSEASNQEILWDLFDPLTDDGVTLGFAPLWDVLTGEQRVTPALTTIFSFSTALKDITSVDTQIGNLLSNEETAPNSDAFAANETNQAGRPDLQIVPLYREIEIGDTIEVVSTNQFGNEGNKLGARRYLRFSPSTSGDANLAVTGAAVDIDVVVFERGNVIGFGFSPGATENVTFEYDGGQDYVIEVYDCANAGCNSQGTPGNTTITVTLD